jgi:Cyclophilin-like family
MSFADCDKDAPVPNSTNTRNTVTIKTGSSTFTATLPNNATATAFKEQLSMAASMTGLNGKESISIYGTTCLPIHQALQLSKYEICFKVIGIIPIYLCFAFRNYFRFPEVCINKMRLHAKAIVL